MRQTRGVLLACGWLCANSRARCQAFPNGSLLKENWPPTEIVRLQSERAGLPRAKELLTGEVINPPKARQRAAPIKPLVLDMRDMDAKGVVCGGRYDGAIDGPHRG